MTGLDVWEVILRQSHAYGCLGQPRGFTEAHCVAPACRPLRTAIFTGKTPPRSSLVNGSPDDADQIQSVFCQFISASMDTILWALGSFFTGGLQFFDLAGETEQRWSPFSKAQEAPDFEQVDQGFDHLAICIENVPKGEPSCPSMDSQ